MTVSAKAVKTGPGRGKSIEVSPAEYRAALALGLTAQTAAGGISVERLLVARDAGSREHVREGRRTMASLVEEVYECLADEATPDPKDRSTMARELLSANAQQGFELPWLGYVDPLVALARQTPFEVSTYLKRSARPRGRGFDGPAGRCRAGESQGDLAFGLGLSQAQVSRKLSGRCGWAVAELDRLSAHYGIAVVDLVVGPTHALRLLPDKRRALIGGTQTVITV
ncbi:helix-turn-helix domain-containing protein [Kitasatospora sp. NPDC059327]|uniref:helix-turn-helix domain-containing protein n=1 Tax=Kitasatospora sp. NPDC059327 TaxID=3346803 RepID=UPI0036800F2A